MPLGFLLPAFLAGLAALGVPILLHLRQREKAKPQRFPSLMFLARIPIRTAQRRRITDWPLLLLRLLVLALLIFAFARPLFRRAADALAKTPGRSVVLAFDRSMSMGHRDSWKAAQDSARAVIGALGVGDRVAVLAFDEEATIAQRFTADHGAALAAVARLRPGARGTHFASAWRAARELLAADSTGRAELIAITDLQRAGGGTPDGVTLPKGVTMRTIAVGPTSLANTAVSSIEIERRAGEGRGQAIVAARLRGYALGAPRRTTVTMTLGGRVSGTRDVTIPEDGVAKVTFDPVPLPAGDLQLAIATEPDALPGDDTFHAIIPADAGRRLILVLPPDATERETLFLERALEIGNDPRIVIDRRLGGTLDPATLRNAAAVMFWDVAPQGGSVGTALATWLRAGGGAVIIAGPRLALRGLDGALTPGRPRGVADRTADRGGRFGELVEEHPIFTAFRGGTTGSLGAARFARYARLDPSGTSQVLARFDDGSPALLERREESGRVLLSAVPLDERDGDFPRQGAFLPFVRRLVLYAAGGDGAPLWHTAGEAWRPTQAIPDLVIASPSGELMRPDAAHGGAITLAEGGVYQAYRGRIGGEPVAVVGVNPPASESDLARLAPQELLLGVGDDATAAAAMGPPTSVTLEQRQQLWRWFLLGMALLLLVETWLSHRGWRGRPGRIVSAPEGGTP